MTQYPYVVVATPRAWRSGPSFVLSRHRTIDAAIVTAHRRRPTTRSDYRLIAGRVDRPYRVGEDIDVVADLSPTEQTYHEEGEP